VDTASQFDFSSSSFTTCEASSTQGGNDIFISGKSFGVIITQQKFMSVSSSDGLYGIDVGDTSPSSSSVSLSDFLWNDRVVYVDSEVDWEDADGCGSDSTPCQFGTFFVFFVFFFFNNFYFFFFFFVYFHELIFYIIC
jgi:hypothetical protein